ncbi:MAG: bifunctional UDP-sugar hydrolase/5'-nucleotidase, partial [Myxococcota bacterium]
MNLEHTIRNYVKSSIWLVIALCAGCASKSNPPEIPQAPEPACVTLLATNDVHGSIESKVNTASGHSVEAGGLLAMSGYVDAIRQTSPYPVMLLDAGDIYQGTLVSNHSWGRALIDIYNAMGFDAAVLGNHEFDFGDGERKDKDVLGVVRDRVAQAEFPFLTANVYVKETGTAIDWPNTRTSVLIDKGPLKVGLIGGSTTATPETTKAQNVVSLRFPDPAPIIIEESKKLRAAGADLIVFVAHMGAGCTDLSDPHDLSSCKLDSEMFDVLKRLPKGTIDIAAGGHTHQYVGHWFNGVATVEAGARARSLARVDACLADEGGISIKRSRIHQPIEICGTQWQEGGCGKRDESKGTQASSYADVTIRPNSAVLNAAKPHLAAVEDLKNSDLQVELPFDLVRGDVPLERNLGLLIAQGMARTTSSGLAIHNRGGVRADLEAGPVSFGEVFMVSPFGNTVAHMKLTPQEIDRFVELLYKRRSEIPYLAGLVAIKDSKGLS